MKAGVAVLGSGNIGTDLMVKVLRRSTGLEMVAMVGGQEDMIVDVALDLVRDKEQSR